MVFIKIQAFHTEKNTKLFKLFSFPPGTVLMSFVVYFIVVHETVTCEHVSSNSLHVIILLLVLLFFPILFLLLPVCQLGVLVQGMHEEELLPEASLLGVAEPNHTVLGRLVLCLSRWSRCTAVGATGPQETSQPLENDAAREG